MCILLAMSACPRNIDSAVIGLVVSGIFIFGAVKCSQMVRTPDYEWVRLKGDLEYTFCVAAFAILVVVLGFLLNIYSFFVVLVEFKS